MKGMIVVNDNNTQEKITFNINIMELAKIDYLVSNGFYSNRSDFLRTALRNQLTQHQIFVSDEAVKEKLDTSTQSTTSFKGIGILHLSKEDLLNRAVLRNTKIDILIFGSLFIDKKVDLELFKKSVNSIKVYGVLKGPKEIVKYVKSLNQ